MKRITQAETSATRHAKPANYKWEPKHWQTMTEAEKTADFFAMLRVSHRQQSHTATLLSEAESKTTQRDRQN